MEVYIGMDISLQTTHICVVDKNGKIVHEGSAASEVAALELHLLKLRRTWKIQKVGFETGQLSTHLYMGLHAAGFPVLCMDARHAHGMLKAQRAKTDKNDARGLAQIVRSGWYRAVHVKSADSQALSAVVHGRKQIVRTRLDLENHIRGVLKTFGVKLGLVTKERFDLRVKESIVGLHDLTRTAMIALLEGRAGLLQQEKRLDKETYRLARADAVCKRLMTIPGVGEQTALSYRAEIDDPTRFRKSRDVGVHVGLTPHHYSSGEIDRSGGISKCGNAALRSLLFEAAVSLLARSRKWSRLKAWGVKLAKRSSFHNACAAVARKLAVIMHRMWIDETEFVYGAVAA